MPSTLDFQSFDKSNKQAKKSVQEVLASVATNISDPFKAMAGNKESQGRVLKKVATAMTDPMMATFAGVKGAVIAGDLERLGKLAIAENMVRGLERGTKEFTKADKKAWKETGWTHGFADGKPRYEIHDGEAKVGGSRLIDYANDGIIEGELKSGKTADVYNHPELYKAYPELAEGRTTISMKYGDSFYTKDPLRRPSIHATSPDYEHPTIIAHEGQHHVQEVEGFARGGSPSEFTSGVAGRRFRSNEEQYYNLAGEVEARLTENRLKMNPEERAKSYPVSMMDRKVKNQTVIPQGMSVREYIASKLSKVNTGIVR